MSRRLVVLLPPSEGKAPGGDGPPWTPGTLAVGDLDAARAEVLAALDRDRGSAIAGGPTLPAIERYTGVLYRELDAASLRGPALRRFRSSTLVASGLWGVVAPTDPIPDYKLNMGASLPPLGKLSTWWRPRLTAALAARVRGATVWDLLPNEHAAAIDWDGLAPARRITIRFVDQDDVVVAHWNKLLKGSIVRWLATSGARDAADLGAFDHPQGYRLDEAGSEWDGRQQRVLMRQTPGPRGVRRPD